MADRVLCVRPSCFDFNQDTANTNSFQLEDNSVSPDEIQDLAIKEFDEMMDLLGNNGVDVVILQDESRKEREPSPDAVFPNNWFSTHLDINDRRDETKTLVLYPMNGHNRRLERNIKGFEFLKKSADRIIDYTEFENKDQFLEGTGSMVLDRERRICYAAVSTRTNKDLVLKFCEDMNYTPHIFSARRKWNAEQIYHTNVMMSIGPSWVVCCIDVVHIESEKEALLKSLRESGRELILISEDQLNKFCANILSIKPKKGESVTVMSQTAHDAFDPNVREKLGKKIVVKVPTIEKFGGGSARCMLAELFYS